MKKELGAFDGTGWVYKAVGMAHRLRLAIETGQITTGEHGIRPEDVGNTTELLTILATGVQAKALDGKRLDEWGLERPDAVKFLQGLGSFAGSLGRERVMSAEEKDLAESLQTLMVKIHDASPEVQAEVRAQRAEKAAWVPEQISAGA